MNRIPARVRTALRLAALPLIAVFALTLIPAMASAQTSPPTVAPYGLVSEAGGYDSAESAQNPGGATYTMPSGADAPLTTSNLTPGKLVYPLGMAVIPDPNVTGGQDIYVLDNTNPQELNAVHSHTEIGGGTVATTTTNAQLQYRIQEFTVAADGTIDPTPAASTTFTLNSSSSYPFEHAVSLAVDPNSGRVYVLVDDLDPALATALGGSDYTTAEEVDAWTLALTAPTSGAAPLTTAVPTSEMTVPSGSATPSELVGPDVSTELLSANGIGDIDGESIAVAGTGTDAELALGGNEWGSATTVSTTVAPTVEEFTNAGGLDTSKGSVGLWQDAPATESAAAQWDDPLSSGKPQTSNVLAQLSANPDGSLNAVFLPTSWSTEGPTQWLASEPNTATIPANLDAANTTPVLPTASTETLLQDNPDAAGTFSDESATDGLAQDPASSLAGNNLPIASGATYQAGTLAPSVIQLSGDNSAFPEGLYAGVVADSYNFQQPEYEWSPSQDIYDNWNANTSAPGPTPAWTLPSSISSSGSLAPLDNISMVEPASIGIRIFDSAGDPVAFIGNQTASTPNAPQPCNIEGGPDTTTQSSGTGDDSYIALAPGSNGAVFALVQPDLTSQDFTGASDGFVDPTAPVGEGEGDEILEFAPGAGTTGPGTECPQPSNASAPNGVFSVANESGSTPTTYSSATPITVTAGTEFQFDASDFNLQGGAAWDLDWTVSDSSDCSANASLTSAPWTVGSGGDCVLDQGAYWDNNEFSWYWPTMGAKADAVEDFTFVTPGTYTVTGDLVNDFGTPPATQTVNVVADNSQSQLQAAFTVGANPTAGQSVSFNANGSTEPSYDSIVDYHWSWGDNSIPDDESTATDTHTFASAGTYTVTLTITDALGHTATFSQQVTVAAPPPSANNESTTPPPSNTNTSTNTTPTPTPSPTPTPASLKLTPSKDVLKAGVTSATLVLQVKSLKSGTKLAVKLSEPGARAAKAKSAKVGAKGVIRFATGKLPAGTTTIRFYETVGKGKKAKLKLVKTETVKVTAKKTKKKK